MAEKKPHWKIWGVNATYRCVRDEGHRGGCQYVYIGREARHNEDNEVPASVNEGEE